MVFFSNMKNKSIMEESSDDSFAVIPTRLSNVNVTLRTGEDMEMEHALGENYIIQTHDVICVQRGCRESAIVHPGNERFKVIIGMHVERYQDTNHRVDKNHIIREVVDIVRQSGRFIRQDLHGRWYDVGNIRAREKARFLLRRQKVFEDNNSMIDTHDEQQPIDRNHPIVDFQVMDYIPSSNHHPTTNSFMTLSSSSIDTNHHPPLPDHMTFGSFCNEYLDLMNGGPTSLDSPVDDSMILHTIEQ
jgi:hypothetical protein